MDTAQNKNHISDSNWTVVASVFSELILLVVNILGGLV